MKITQHPMRLVHYKEIPTQTVAVPRNPSSVYRVCQQMEGLCKRKEGKGLSAVQVGIDWKFFIADDNDDGQFRYFVDCEYYPEDLGAKKTTHIEGCLSLPGRIFRTKRWPSVKVVGEELVVDKGELKFIPFEHITDAIVFQHEIDHHNNILISDFGSEVFPMSKGDLNAFR